MESASSKGIDLMIGAFDTLINIIMIHLRETLLQEEHYLTSRSTPTFVATTLLSPIITRQVEGETER